MKCLGWFVLSLVGLVLISVERSEAYPQRCAGNSGFPREKCCDECPVCRYNFDVEAPKDPGCRRLHRYHYDVQKITGCNKETYDRLDAAVEVLPEKGCKKSYQYHYDVEDPHHCNEESYDTFDFEVVAPKKEKKCRKVKLEAYADHPTRECQCDCNMRRYVKTENSQNRTLSNNLDKNRSIELNDSDRNRIRRLKRHLPYHPGMEVPVKTPEQAASDHLFFKHLRRANRPGMLRNEPNQRRLKRKEKQGFQTSPNGFVCHCLPAGQSEYVTHENEEVVGAPRKATHNREQPVYIGDSSNPITYDQIKKHMDALPRSEYSPTTNDVIGNLTVLFYDIYQQKHKKNFTLPLKYGTRTVVEKGDGLQQYDIKPIEGEYQPPTLNRFASKGLSTIGRKIDRKTGQNGPRRNRLQRRP